MRQTNYQFGRTNRIRLGTVFSNILIHDGVPEIGNIEERMQNIVIWLFTKEELVCVKEDAERIVNRKDRFYNGQLKAAARRALEILSDRVGQIEARDGPIVWPK